jgi:hypothetical protein
LYWNKIGVRIAIGDVVAVGTGAVSVQDAKKIKTSAEASKFAFIFSPRRLLITKLFLAKTPFPSRKRGLPSTRPVTGERSL